MPARRILLLGAGDLTDETCAALEAAGADVARLEDPDAEELREALERGADAVAVVSRDDAWPLRAALLVRHLDADVPIVATIFDPATGRELEQEIGNITITSLADIVAPTLAGPVPRRRPRRGARRRRARPGCAATAARSRPRRCPRSARAARARSRPRSCSRSTAAPRSCSSAPSGSLLILVAETVAAAIVLDQSLVDAFYGAVKTLVTVDPNPEVQDGPKWFKVVDLAHACWSRCCSPPRSPAGSSSG